MRPQSEPGYGAAMPSPLTDLPFPAAMLFDLDGTLVDTVAPRIQAWLAALAEAGIAATRDEVGPLIGIDGKRLARELAARAAKPIGEQQAEAIDRRSGELYQALNRDPKPLPGIRETVVALQRRNIAWAIATSSRAGQVTTSVAALGLPESPRIIDASGVEHAKPEPDLLLQAAEQLGVQPERCWYVGDATWDMVAAVAAAMIPIGVTAGSGVDARALTTAGAAACIPTLSELARWLDAAPDRRTGAG
jgi:HAD superfamily hydrolase (TIGR01509 family)